jgi:hypothetical protein
MAVQFSTPKSPAKNVFQIDEFLGVDFSNSPANADDNKSPNAQNMIRDVPGKVRKRMGYEVVDEYEYPIYGYHYIKNKNVGVVHSGTNLYLNDAPLWTTCAEKVSKGWQFDEKMYIVDGKEMVVFDGETVVSVSSIAYIPTLTIGKDPSGGGTDYEALNLLQPGFTEMFLATEEATEYQMTFNGLDETTVQAWILDEDAEWTEKVEGTDFTVDRTTGTVTFSTAPGLSPITGQDNVKITAYRTVEGYQDRINKCTIGILFGINGGADRLFLSGNPTYINYDWYSGQYDPTYFPDTGYAMLGNDSSAIVGYSIISNYLAAHKDESENTQSILLREGDLIENEPAFKLINTLQGAGAIARNSFGYLCTEPLFLTRLGVYAVTAQDITGEKYSQNRSFFIDGKLLKESNLEEAFAYVYKDMYWLCVNDVAYILDGLQPIRTDKSMPYATRQYAGFYCTNIGAKCMWEQDGDLYFGRTDGKICKFFSDPDALASYNDDGVAIDAYWETPDLDGKMFYKNKSFTYFAIRLKTAISTSCTIYGFLKGVWSILKNDTVSGRYFSYENLVYSKFTYSNDNTQKIIPLKLRIKKVDKARFRVRNNALNEPFGIYDLALEYRESGNYKR